MWLGFLGLMNGIAMGLVYSIEELWMGVFFCLVPFAGILLTKKKVCWFVMGYGLGYYMTGLSFLWKLTEVLPLPFYTAHVLMAAGILLLSLFLTFFLVLTMCPLYHWRRGKNCDIFMVAAMYVLAEWLQGVIPVAAFPWFRLSAVVAQRPILIQGASIGGSLFVSFLIMLWNAALARSLIRHRIDFSSLSAFALIGMVLLYGEVRLYETKTQGDTVLILQGNHEGSEKWDRSSQDIFTDYVQLIREYAVENTGLIVLPETALPYAVEENEETKRTVQQLCRELSTEFLVGGIQTEWNHEEKINYNAVYHVTEEGVDEKVYRKRRLVPFGEYLPLETVISRYCPWVSEWMRGNCFEKGQESVVFDTRSGAVGILVCYESLFSEEAREAVHQGAEFLAILSNDSWFQGTPALRQHHVHAVLRAVESDRYVIRAGNTGISSVIDSRGRVQGTLQEGVQGGLYAQISARESRTIYSRWGDSWIWIFCMIYFVLLFRQVSVLIFLWLSAIIKRQRRG